MELTKLKAADGQLIQGILMRVSFDAYFKVIKDMCEGDEQKLEIINGCVERLKAQVTVNDKLIYCEKENAQDISSLTIGELLLAAENCIMQKREDTARLRAFGGRRTEAVGRGIIEDILIIPLTCPDPSAFGIEPALQPKTKESDPFISAD